MDGIPTVGGIAQAIALGYRVIVKPDGTVEIEANGKESHRFVMEAVDRIGPLNQERFHQEAIRVEAQRIIDQARASSAKTTASPPAPIIPSIQIGKAVMAWLAEIKSSTKTYQIKTTAVDGFAVHYGEKNPLGEVGRIDVGNWVQALREAGLQAPTAVNKLSYLMSLTAGHQQ